MAAPLPLNRPRILLASILTAYFILLSLQAKSRENGNRSQLEGWTLVILRPLASGVSTLVENAREAGTGIVDLRGAAMENARLREDLRTRGMEINRLHQLQGEVERLESLLGYRSAAAPSGSLARVIYADTRGWFKSIIVDRGTESGITVGSPVLGSNGLVGRVVYSTADLSKVQLLIDSTASVGVLCERTRVQGVARGDGAAGMTLNYVPRGADIRAGDRILTAGNDGIYPPGTLVGVVLLAAEGDGSFREIKVRPAAALTSLESVLVLPAANLPADVREFRP